MGRQLQCISRAKDARCRNDKASGSGKGVLLPFWFGLMVGCGYFSTVWSEDEELVMLGQLKKRRGCCYIM
jgi:hypothetical protein